MGLIEILVAAGLIWVLVLALVVGLCLSARQGDRVIIEMDVADAAPPRRFRSTA